LACIWFYLIDRKESLDRRTGKIQEGQAKMDAGRIKLRRFLPEGEGV
jgi:hypothetical protein